jgi:20S proteasome subunit beta 1
LSAGIIVAGWDKENGGGVFNVPLGGGIFQQPWAIGGELRASGSLIGLS